MGALVRLTVDTSPLAMALRRLASGLTGEAIEGALMAGMHATHQKVVTPETWQAGVARYDYHQSGETFRMFQTEEPMKVPDAPAGVVMIGWGDILQRFNRLKRKAQRAVFRVPAGARGFARTQGASERVIEFKAEKQLPTWVIMEYGVSGTEAHADLENMQDLTSVGIAFQRTNSQRFTPTRIPGYVSGLTKPIFPNLIRGRNHPGVWPGGGFRRSLQLTQSVYVKNVQEALHEVVQTASRGG